MCVCVYRCIIVVVKPCNDKEYNETPCSFLIKSGVFSSSDDCCVYIYIYIFKLSHCGYDISRSEERRVGKECRL